MTKIHIALVGGQAAPVYNGIVYTDPDRVIMIHSDESITQAERIKSEINIPCELCRTDPVNMYDIEQKALIYAEKYKKESISINISSGTKLWTYFFTKTFGQLLNTEIFYIDQNNCIWNLTHKTTEIIEFNTNVHFRLYGAPLVNYIPFSSYTEDDISVIEKIEELRKFHYVDFNRLTDLFEKQTNLTEKTLLSGSYLRWDKNNKTFNVFLKRNSGMSINKSLHSLNVRSLLLNSGWFEYKVALFISKWDKCREIIMNCKFLAKTNAPKNEVDIIVNTGTKFLFVECKTQISKINEIDKFNSVVKNYGGMGSKALFVTDAQMPDTAKEKCKEYNILSFSLQEKHLNMENDQALSFLLNKELFNINIK
jgi:hypothetical protein